MVVKRSSLTPLFITSGIAGLALGAMVGAHDAQALSAEQDRQQSLEELLNKTRNAIDNGRPVEEVLKNSQGANTDADTPVISKPDAPRQESAVLIGDMRKLTRNNARISEYTALIETHDKKLVVCAGLKIEDYSFQESKPVDKAQVYVTSPQVADLLRPAPEEETATQGTAQNGRNGQNKIHSFGSCMPYRVHFSDSVLNALRQGNPGPMIDYMGQVADPVGMAVIDSKDGVLASQWMNMMSDPSKRLPDFELPDPVEPPKFDDNGKQRDYIRALQDQPPYKIDNMKSCPNTGYNDELAAALYNYERRTTAPIRLRGCTPI
jgi:hypothetical protein